jgi:hypothetical protein
MAGGEDQNPASSSPGLIGEVVGSDEGLTTISFWGLDGGETWPVGAAAARWPTEPCCGVGTTMCGQALDAGARGCRTGGAGTEGGQRPDRERPHRC